MEKRKKLFFTKEDNTAGLIEKINEEQMAKIVGGLDPEWKEKPPTTYTESTYVRRV